MSRGGKAIHERVVRFGFRQSERRRADAQHVYYYLNGIRVNYRGDNLQGADYDSIDSGGKGDAYDTLPGFLPPSAQKPGLAAGGAQLPAAELQLHPHPSGARRALHARHGRRARPDAHGRNGHSRQQQRSGFRRRPRQHGRAMPRPWCCAIATTPRSCAGASATSPTAPTPIRISSRPTCSTPSPSWTARARSARILVLGRELRVAKPGLRDQPATTSAVSARTPSR